MTRTELEERLTKRYWDRLRMDFPEAEQEDDVPTAIRWRIRQLVADLYDLGVIVDTVPSGVPRLERVK